MHISNLEVLNLEVQNLEVLKFGGLKFGGLNLHPPNPALGFQFNILPGEALHRIRRCLPGKPSAWQPSKNAWGLPGEALNRADFHRAKP